MWAMIQKVFSRPVDGAGARCSDEVVAGIPVTAERTMSAVTHIHLGHAFGGRAGGNEVRHAA